MPAPRSRSELYDGQRDHPWLGRLHTQLSAREDALARQFICDHDHLDVGPFELAVNRMFVDRPNRPRRWTIIMELLTCVNSTYRADRLPRRT